MRMMDQDAETGPVNIGNPYEISILELAERILKATDSSSEIIRKDLPSDDPTRRRPDITKAKKILGWEPEVSFDNGLAQTVEYFRELLTVEERTR